MNSSPLPPTMFRLPKRKCAAVYSAKFPEVSAALLRKKLDGIADTGADRVVMDCPGCVLQIRGGAEKDGKGLKVTHISELLAENLKK
mgnify:CR=1 FL=1